MAAVDSPRFTLFLAISMSHLCRSLGGVELKWDPQAAPQRLEKLMAHPAFLSQQWELFLVGELALSAEQRLPGGGMREASFSCVVFPGVFILLYC